MDRWPSEREEPKAPDKNVDALNSKDSNIIMKLKSEPHFPNCGKTDDYSPRVLPPNKESSVSSLNEPDLKALLEEAMAYKRPKDIQGKSDLFKELLQSVECEKKYSMLSRPEKQSNRKPRRKQMNKKEIDKTTHEGPFQDLIVHMSDGDATNKRQMKYSLKCSASNVPQLVPVDATIFQESNADVQSLLENGTIDSLEELQEMLASEANIYQVKETPVGSGESRTIGPLTMSSYLEESEEEAEARIGVKDVLNLSSITNKESGDLSDLGRDAITESKKSLDENGNSLSNSRIESLAERKAKARRIKAKNDRNTILSHHIEGHRSDIAQDIDAIMKYIESPKISDSKSGRQRNSVGLQKNASRTSSKMSRVRDKSTEAFSRKSPKNKDNKLNKSSSLEEVSISKFEDLTQENVKEDSPKSTTKSRNIQDSPEVSTPKERPEIYPVVSRGTVSVSERTDLELVEADFLPVTKKNRKKKIIAESSIRNSRGKISGNYRSDKVLSSYIVKSQKLDGFPSSSREFKRRKSISSIPSSDKSGDSSDLDSVHSFPVSSSKGKGNKASVSLYTGSTPQISYADIARSVPSPSRLHPELSPSADNIDECDYDNLYSPQESIPTVILQLPSKKEYGKGSVDLHQDYPPLNAKCADKNFSSSDMFVEYTVLVPKRTSCTFQSNCVNVEETVLIEMPSSDISEMEGMNIAVDDELPSKRPPVILMNNNSNDVNEVNDLEFGFEVNEQLLNCSSTESLENSDESLDENNASTIEEIVEVEGEIGEEEDVREVLEVEEEVKEEKDEEKDKEKDEEKEEDIELPESPTKTQLEEPFNFEISQNLMEIIQYVYSEWESTLAELQNEDNIPPKVVYFNP